MKRYCMSKFVLWIAALVALPAFAQQGKVEVLWHKHAIFRGADGCTGCLRCVRACQHGALAGARDRSPAEAPALRFDGA